MLLKMIIFHSFLQLKTILESSLILLFFTWNIPSSLCLFPPPLIQLCVCCAILSCFSHVRLFATLWTVTHQAPLSMGFSRQEYWSGLRCPSPGNLPDLRIEPTFLTYPALQVGSLPLVPPRKHLFTPSNMCMFNSKNHYLPACVVVQLPSHV